MRSQLIFFLFDSVHISKCITNNKLGQKDASKCMLFPKLSHNGNNEFNSIQNTPFCNYQKFQSILKYCYKLSLKYTFSYKS